MFNSFFHGGFECATGYNRDGDWIDLVVDTAHHEHLHEDYRRLRDVGILTVRDAIRWPVVDLGGGRHDFSSVAPMVDAAARFGIQVIWDLFHYGYPPGVDLLSEAFAERFADYCAACARYLRGRIDGTLWFTPVNEPSYFSWAAGEAGHFAPHLSDSAFVLKVALVRAAIRAIDAIRAEVPQARILNADPICRVVPSDGSPDAVDATRRFNEEVVFESWDMLAGRTLPELGGSRAHLDVAGVNYYWNCQWVHGEQGSWLEHDDPRRLPVRDIVRTVHERYGGDVVISETSHWGDNRADWLEHIEGEVVALLDAGIPLRGVCLYPIIGMLDWHAPRRWMPMGLWDIDAARAMGRVLHRPSYEALRRAQRHLTRFGHPPPRARMA